MELFRNDMFCKYKKILLLLVCSSLTTITLFNFFFIISDSKAQTISEETLYQITKQSPLDKNYHIKVGKEPYGMVLPSELSFDLLYVSNFGSDTVSVVSTINNTKIKDISLEKNSGPMQLVYLPSKNKIYVSNNNNANVSVISTENDTKIKDIPVGESPVDIVVDTLNHKAYVTNYNSSTVSVISTENDTKSGQEISVGLNPFQTTFNPFKDVIYVSNSLSEGVSVIDGEENKVVGRFYFDVNPPNSGFIQCDKISSPTKKFFYIWSNTFCTAIPNKGFKFFSWEENLTANATQIINVSKPATTIES